MASRYDSIYREGLFEGQVALVTGGGTGIGRCVAHELAALGATVVVSGRRPGPLERVVAEIAQDGGEAACRPLDIRDQDDARAALREIVAAHGRLDMLVNNAGGQFVSGAEDIRPKGWRAVIDTNLNGTFWVTQAAFHAWMGEHGGAIVNVVADMWNGFPGMCHTGAARAAVVNMTRTLAIEWAPSGIRVNAVAPGIVLSSGMKSYPEEVLEVALEVGRQNPSGRLGTESEVSSAILWLLGPGAAYVTGAALRVDGGSSLSKAPLLPFEAHGALPPYRGFHRRADLPARLEP